MRIYLRDPHDRKRRTESALLDVAPKTFPATGVFQLPPVDQDLDFMVLIDARNVELASQARTDRRLSAMPKRPSRLIPSISFTFSPKRSADSMSRVPRPLSHTRIPISPTSISTRVAPASNELSASSLTIDSNESRVSSRHDRTIFVLGVILMVFYSIFLSL